MLLKKRSHSLVLYIKAALEKSVEKIYKVQVKTTEIKSFFSVFEDHATAAVLYK